MDSKNTWTNLLDSDWCYDLLELYWKVLRLPWIWTDFMIYWTWAWKATWNNLLEAPSTPQPDWFYHNQAGMLFKKSENLLELSAMQLVIQSR